MRMIRRTISTLLALQLLVSFGLCGAVCCASGNASPAAQASSREHSHGGHSANHESSPKPAAKKHCHTKSEPAQAEQAPEQEKDKDEHQVQANNAHHGHAKKPSAGFSAAAALQKACACGEANQPASELSQSNPSSNVKQAVIDCSPLRHCVEDALPPRLALRHSSRPHSPPDGGFQLSLRI